ncbi:cytochrome P450 20A1-like [Elysia marginata]|uniref:Cytochrome P450 20A1-like n=1 Tax=Elysia marginata TaxID=1093978 RepID=A0AAV4I2D5_9GAST|nr:cytochrome P450 20A1-like [Elysia marginata]
MLDFAIFAVCFLSTLLIAIIWLYPSSKKVTTIPGMNPTSKEDGNISDIGRAGSMHEFLTELHGQYGPIAGFWFGQTYTVSIASPELFKQHSNVFDRPTELFRMFEPLIGPASLQYANGADGRARRKHYEQAFSHFRLSSYYEMFQKAADQLVKNWSSKNEQDHVPLSEDLFVFAVRAALLTTLGEFFRDDKLLQSFHNAYEKVWGELEHRLKDPIMPGKDSSRMKQFEEAREYMRKTVNKIVQHRKEETLQGTLLIDDIIEFAESEDVISSDSITFVVGAFHTTANLLTWCLYFLATHEEVQEKVYQEIMNVLGDKDLVEDTNLNKFIYTHQVLDESLRCGVVAPWAARVQDFDSELGGHKVPKNTPVIHALGVVLQDEKIWPLPNRVFSENDHININSGKGITLQKPGKAKGPVTNLRPITLLNTLRKVLSLIVLNRTKHDINEYLSPSQSGLREGRSTSDIEWSHRWLVSKTYAENIDFFITGIDMSSDVDTIDRHLLLNIMKNIIKEDEQRIIRYLLSNTEL